MSATRSNLPSGYTFCNPGIGLAHGSLKSYSTDVTPLLHYTEVDDTFQTTYVLDAINLFSRSSKELHFLLVKHHIKEGWYLADGVVLSSDYQVNKFLLDKPYYARSYEAMDKMNETVKRIVPKMLRKNGMSRIQPLILLSEYTW